MNVAAQIQVPTAMAWHAALAAAAAPGRRRPGRRAHNKLTVPSPQKGTTHGPRESPWRFYDPGAVATGRRALYPPSAFDAAPAAVPGQGFLSGSYRNLHFFCLRFKYLRPRVGCRDGYRYSPCKPAHRALCAVCLYWRTGKSATLYTFGDGITSS